MVRPSHAPAASGSRHGEGPESGASAMECEEGEARAPAREGMAGESVAAKTGAGLVRALWPECAREPAQAPAESLHRMVSGFLASEPSWKDVFLRGVETEPFALVVARLVEELPQQTKRNSRAAAETVAFLTDCLDHLHLKCVREAILPLLGFRLWKFVDPERLQAHLRSSERVKRQWTALEQANSEKPDLTVDARARGFWSLLLQLATGKTLVGEHVHLETFDTDHPLPVTILSFVRSCLRSPITRRFLLLLLESLQFVALCTASGKFDRSAWLLTDIDNLIECGEKSDEEVERFVVARLRLFQRVAFRHFENSLGATVLGPTAMVSNAIQEGALEQLEYQEVEELVQKLGLAYSAKASDAQEEKDREFFLQLLRSKHQRRQGYHGLLRELEREGAMWKLTLPGERQTNPIARTMSMSQISVLVEELQRRIQSCQPQLQYLSESELLWYETRRLCDQSVMAAAVDILSAVDLLELAVDPTTKKLTAPGWSRMAARALLRTSTSGTLDLSGTPDMVLNEWNSLAQAQDIVIFAEFIADSQGVALGGVFAGRFLALDRATGQVTLQWSSNRKPFPREDTVIVAIRGNAATDTYRRKVKCLLASAVARTGPQTLLPPTLASALLGQAQLAHPTLMERIKLFQSRRSESGLDTNTVAQLVQGVKYGSSERVLIVSYTAAAAFSIERQVKDSSILLTAQPNDASLATAVSTCLAKRMDLLEQVSELAEGLGINTGGALTCEGANVFFELYVKPELDRYIASLSQEGEPADFPFAFFFGGRDNKKTANKFEVNSLRTMFQELETLRIFELVLDPKERHRLVLERQAQVVVASLQSVVAHLSAPNWQERRLHFTRIVLLESSRMNMGDMLLALSLLASPERVDSFYCVGDAFGDFPRGALDKVTLFERMTRLGGAVVPAPQAQDMAPTASSLHEEVLQAYQNSAGMNRRDVVLPGVLHSNNFVGNPGSSEIAVGSSQFQNVSEAEYLVALYQYLLLIGYQPTQVAILCTYKAQELLVLDVLHSRCNPLRMPLPSLVTAVEDMPDHTWDIVLVSLVRTGERGITSDLRRQVAIFQAARLGLFVIGNRDLYREDMILASLMKDDDTQGGLVLLPQERCPGNPERSSQSEDKSILVKSAKDMSILATQMIMARQQN